jgi:hypothetical protein
LLPLAQPRKPPWVAGGAIDQTTQVIVPDIAQFDIVNVTNNQYRHDPGQGYPYYNPWIGADPLGRRYAFSLSYRF